MKNSQVAILCGAILAGSLIVAGTNVWLLRAVGAGPAGLRRTRAGAARGAPAS